MNKKIPATGQGNAAVADTTSIMPIEVRGHGTRSGWPLLPVGEAQRRDPHVPDAVPGANRPVIGQGDSAVAPSVEKRNGYGAGGGVVYTGFPPALQYVKRIGSAMTRTLARAMVAGTLDAQWRVGGVSLPPDFGFGIGQTMAADAIWPQNPQVTMRNPGIHPQHSAPQTYRLAPNMGIQDVGPSIADIGNMLAR